MADEQQKSSSNSGKRRRRRRPSRKRKRSGQPNSNDVANAPAARSGSKPEPRSGQRRRRRRKSRSRASSQRRDDMAIKVDALDARLPESIFVYTHVLRSSELDTYGFRSDPFLNSSRGLEDFRIDLSPLFPEDESQEGEAEMRIFDDALHGPIVTSIADETTEDAEENIEEDGEQPVGGHE